MKQHKKNNFKPKYLLFGLIGICFIMMTVSYTVSGANSFVQSTIGTIIVPMQKGLNSFGSWISQGIQNAKTVSALQEENEKLQLDIDTLKSQISSMENNLSELETLRDLLSLKEKYPSYNMVGARIISADTSNWYKVFTIDKGSLDGIQVDMNVIADNGLVGIVIETGLTHSKVRSIIDDSSYVSAMNMNTLDMCVVKGDLQLIDQGLLFVEMISADAAMNEGDALVTSYISEKYLPGLPIGYLTNITEDAAKLTKSAWLTPIVDFEHLTDVLVITQLKADLLKDEEATDESTETAE